MLLPTNMMLKLQRIINGISWFESKTKITGAQQNK